MILKNWLSIQWDLVAPVIVAISHLCHLFGREAGLITILEHTFNTLGESFKDPLGLSAKLASRCI